MPDLHSDILTERQHEVLSEVAPFAASQGFYLAGGTAVALHLGHRRSDDFDWFSPVSFDPLALAHALRTAARNVEVRSQETGTLHAKASGVKLSFLHYPYPSLHPAISWAEYGFGLASLPDLACTKLAAIASRGARRDFVDIYAMLRSGLTLDQMMRWYRERYEMKDVGHVLFSLSYFDEADAQDAPEMFWKTAWEEMKSAILHQLGKLK
jgi:hypothetical protein